MSKRALSSPVDDRRAALLRLVAEAGADDGTVRPSLAAAAAPDGAASAGAASAGAAPAGAAPAADRSLGRGHQGIRDRIAIAAARCDVGLRGVVALAVVGVVAAAFAGVAYLRARPVALPVGPVSGQVAGSVGSRSPGGGPLAGSTRSLGPSATGAGPPASASGKLVVDVAGRVRRPGVVRLSVGARVADAIRAAGGPISRTDLGLLNLASRLVDGEQVVVGRVAGAATGALTGTSVGTTPGAGTDPTGGAATPVDVNSATTEQLDTLPGVGPVLAQRILDYRSAHGAFRSVDELAQVPGIGPSKLADLRPLVTLEPR